MCCDKSKSSSSPSTCNQKMSTLPNCENSMNRRAWLRLGFAVLSSSVLHATAWASLRPRPHSSLKERTHVELAFTPLVAPARAKEPEVVPPPKLPEAEAKQKPMAKAASVPPPSAPAVNEPPPEAT